MTRQENITIGLVWTEIIKMLKVINGYAGHATLSTTKAYKG